MPRHSPGSASLPGAHGASRCRGAPRIGRSSFLSASRLRPAPPEAPGRLRSNGGGSSGIGITGGRRWSLRPERVRALALPPAAAFPLLAPSVSVSYRWRCRPQATFIFGWNSSVWALWEPGFSHVLRVLGMWWLPAGRCWILLPREGVSVHTSCGQAEMSFNKNHLGCLFRDGSSCDKHATLPALLS